MSSPYPYLVGWLAGYMEKSGGFGLSRAQKARLTYGFPGLSNKLPKQPMFKPGELEKSFHQAVGRLPTPSATPQATPPKPKVTKPKPPAAKVTPRRPPDISDSSDTTAQRR